MADYSNNIIDNTGRLLPQYSGVQNQEPEEKDFGVMDYVKDFSKGVAGGALDAVEGILQTPNAVKELFTGENKKTERILPELKTETALGDISNTITQGALGLVGAGKFLKVLEWGTKGVKAASGAAAALYKLNNATTVAGKIGSGAVKGFISDFTVFDENEERLAEVLNEIPVLSNIVTDYLADREDDSKAEARFKNALEGVGLGALLDSVFIMAKASKSYLKAKGRNLYGKAYNDELEKVLKDIADEQAGKTAGEAADETIKGAGRQTEPVSEDMLVNNIIKHSEKVKANDYESYHKLLTGDKRNKKLLNDIDSLADKIVVNVSKVQGRSVDDLVEAMSRLTKDNPAFTRIQDSNKYLHKTIMETVANKLHTNMSWKQTIRQTDALFNQDLMDKELRNFLKADSEALNTLAPRLLAYRLGTVTQLNKVVRLTEQSLQGRLKSNDELVSAYEELTESLGHTQAIMSGVGRALNSLKIKPDKAELKRIIETAEKQETPFKTKNNNSHHVNQDNLLKGTELEKSAGQIVIVNAKQLKALEKLTEMGADITKPETQLMMLGMARSDKDKFVRLLSEKRMSNTEYLSGSFLTYFVNNLLSSPVTQLFNVAGNVLKLIATPAERIAGGILRADNDEVRSGIRMFIGYKSAISDSLKAAGLALKMGGNILDTSKYYPMNNADQIAARLKWQFAGSAKDINQLEAYQNIRPELETPFKALGHIGAFMQLPLRAMGAADEFFKQMAYRSKIYADTFDEALQAGVADKAAYISKKLEMAFDNGKGINEEALQYARKQTWTQELDGSSNLDRLGIALKSVPALRPFVPFITTPTNLIKDIIEHAPIMNSALKYVREEYKKGGESAAVLEGKAAVGLALGFTGLSLAADGLITGAYPKDREERALWEAQGRLPFSIRLGDKWVPYNRLDPFGAFFGMAATVYDKGMREGGDDLASPLTYAGTIIQYLSSKTYLQGITDLIEAIQNPENVSLQITAGNLLGGLVPMSSALRFAARQLDGELKETRGDMGLRFASNIPFLSNSIPAKYNFITGEKTEPSYLYSNAKDNFVLEQLMPYASSIRGGAPANIIKGVKLNAEDVSRLSQIQGNIIIGGKSLMQALTDLVNSYSWQKAEGRYNQNGESVREQMIEKIMVRYKKQAQTVFLNENPAFQRRITDKQENTRRSSQYMQERFSREVNISDL